MATKFEQYINDAIKSRLITGAAVSAVNKDGDFLLNKAFGKSDVGEDAKDFAMDTTFWMASATKLLTSIAFLQLVEAGKVQPETPVSDFLPEWEKPQILTGFDDDGKPVLKAATKKILMSHLLSHSSGIGYDAFNETLGRYRQASGMGPRSNDTSIPETWPNVLLFEPGEDWEYGVGIDWAGLVIERITGLTLGQYLKANIFDILDMQDTTFAPWTTPTMMDRMHGRVTRDADGKVARFDGDTFAMVPKAFEGGGDGLYSSTADYIKVLKSILLQDEKLLKAGTVERYMRTSQLEPMAREAMQTKLHGPKWGKVCAIGFPWKDNKEIVFDHSLASALMVTKIDGLCGENTMYWGGLPNNNWSIDMETGVAKHYGSWLVPPGDATTTEIYTELTKAIYEEAGKRGSG